MAETNETVVQESSDAAGKAAETDSTVTETSVSEETVDTETPAEQDEVTKAALAIGRAILDPSTSQAVLKDLAKRAGLLKEEEKTPPPAKKSVQDIVREKLGDKFDFLVDPIAGVLDQILADRDANLKDLEKKIAEAHQQGVAAHITQELSGFIESNEVTDAEQVELDKLVKKYPPTGTETLAAYLKPLLIIVRSPEMAKAAKSGQARKTEAAKRASAVQSLPGASETEESVEILTPRDAVELAKRQLAKQGIK